MIVARKKGAEDLLWDGGKFTAPCRKTILFGSAATACNDNRLARRDDWLAVSAFPYMETFSEGIQRKLKEANQS